MKESSFTVTELQEIVQYRVAVFHKAPIVQGDAQLAQRHQDLRGALGAGHTLALKAAIGVLPPAHAGEGFLRCLGHGALILIPGKGLQGHAGDVRVGGIIAGGLQLRAAVQAPAPVRELTRQDPVHIHLPGGLGLGLGIFRDLISAAVQSDERPDGAVEALPDGPFIVPQGGEQIVPGHIGGVCADGRQRDDEAGIFRILLLVQNAAARLHIVLHPRVVLVPIGLRHRNAAPGQTDDRPLASHGAHLRLGHRVQHVCGGGVQRVGQRRRGRRRRRQERKLHPQGKQQAQRPFF